MKHLYFILLFQIAFSINAQNYDFTPGWAVMGKASSNGLGFEVAKSFKPWLTVRGGYEALVLGTNAAMEMDGINYDLEVNYNTGSISLFTDFYAAKSVYFVAGAGLNFFNPKIKAYSAKPVDMGSLNFTSNEIGAVEYSVEPSMPISPYLGLGFGRSIAANKRIAFNVELGSYYIGPPKVTIVAVGMLAPTGDPSNGEVEKIEDLLGDYQFLPLLKVGLSYKFWKQKKVLPEENGELVAK